MASVVAFSEGRPSAQPRPHPGRRTRCRASAKQPHYSTRSLGRSMARRDARVRRGQQAEDCCEGRVETVRRSGTSPNSSRRTMPTSCTFTPRSRTSPQRSFVSRTTSVFAHDDDAFLPTCLRPCHARAGSASLRRVRRPQAEASGSRSPVLPPTTWPRRRPPALSVCTGRCIPQRPRRSSLRTHRVRPPACHRRRISGGPDRGQAEHGGGSGPPRERRKPTIVFAGRLTPEKGVNTLASRVAAADERSASRRPRRRPSQFDDRVARR